MFDNIPVNQRYGYARVSSKSQESNSSLTFQKEELLKQGVPESNIRIEVGSAAGSIQNRPVFHNLIENELEENCLLVVTKIDRCSRNTLSFLKLQNKLFRKSVTFISLDLPYSIDTVINKLIATNLAVIATFEHEHRRERQKQGILAAQKKGNKYVGRKTVITKSLIAEMKYFNENKRLSITKIARPTGKARSTICKILKEELGYVSNRLVKQ